MTDDELKAKIEEQLRGVPPEVHGLPVHPDGSIDWTGAKRFDRTATPAQLRAEGFAPVHEIAQQAKREQS